MWIPDPIYNKLPALYVAGGAALVPAFGVNGPSLISAVMLVAAGVLTAVWRRRHRAEAEAQPTRTPREDWAERRERRLEEMSRFDQL